MRLDHLKIERAVIGGISMGAALALRMALEYSRRVMAIVLSRPAWLDDVNPFNMQAYDEISALIREHGALRGREIFEQSEFFREVKSESPDAAASLLSQFDSPLAEPGVLRLEQIPHQSPHANRNAWAELQIPVLVLGAHGDPIHPFHYAQTLADEIPGGQLRELVSKNQNPDLHQMQTQQFIAEFLQTKI